MRGLKRCFTLYNKIRSNLLVKSLFHLCEDIARNCRYMVVQLDLWSKLNQQIQIKSNQFITSEGKILVHKCCCITAPKLESFVPYFILILNREIPIYRDIRIYLCKSWWVKGMGVLNNYLEFVPWQGQRRVWFRVVFVWTKQSLNRYY